MAIIDVDGRKLEVDGKENLLHVCLSAGLNVPYFCWHPAMGSVGACRQCAVVQYRDDADTTGRLVMACMTPASDKARISIVAPSARRFRSAVVEWLMLNHPHDCPVCEEGGDCHLQDMTVMAGHTTRRYRGRKRTFENQYLGPFLNHEMNRCITCYRCVRFYRDYAGGDDLAAFGSRNRMYFGRAADGVLENPFAGNLVEVCPTGVFTDKPASKTYSRKWDLQSAPSICPGCAVGCNTFPAERYGVLKRVHNRFHHDLNGYFLCDRGRFGAGFVNADVRLTRAGSKCADGNFAALDAAAATSKFATLMQQGPVVGIGSPRASVEANFALRSLVGADNFCSGLAIDEAELVYDVLTVLRSAPNASPTLAEVERADAVLILGEDVLNTAPRVALALRQAARNRTFVMAGAAQIPLWQDAGVRGHAQQARSPCYSATPLPTQCDDFTTATVHAASAQLALLGEAIARVLVGEPVGPLDDASTAFVVAAARDLQAAERPLVVSGTGAMSRDVIAAAAAITRALQPRVGARLLLAVPECNSLGAALLGGLALAEVLEAAASGRIRTLVVLENDLFRRAPAEHVVRALEAVNLVVLDAVETATADRAALALPAAAFAESEGTFINYEGRAQRYFTVFEPVQPIRPAWRWLSAVAETLGRNELNWQHIDELISACDADPALTGIASAAPSANYRGPAHTRVPRQPHRYSGRTAMQAHQTMHETKARVDTESPFSFSMEGNNSGNVGALIPYVWAPGWNSNQAVTRYQLEAGGQLRGGDAGIRLLAGSTNGAAQARDNRLAGAADEPHISVHPRAHASEPATHTNPTQASPRVAELQLLPVHEIFGSDELSGLSPPVRERMPAAYVVLSPADAARLEVAAGDGVRASDSAISFVVRVHAALVEGTAAFPRGLPGVWTVPPPLVSFTRDPEFISAARIIARQ